MMADYILFKPLCKADTLQWLTPANTDVVSQNEILKFRLFSGIIPSTVTHF